MELKEIKNVLEDNLNRPLSDGRKRNIVFWYDDAGEFQDEIDELDLTNAKILKLNGSNNFRAKYILEHEDQINNYLIYAPFGKPGVRENYLLDIEKYSVEFSTDKATAIMRDLKVFNDSLRDGFKRYLKFFNNKERYKVFKSYMLPLATKELLDVAVLSVLCKLPYPDFEEALKVLLAEYAEGKTAIYESIEKFGDLQAFWNLIDKYYGYDFEQKDLDTLTVVLLVTGLSFTLNRELPKTWLPFIASKKSNVVVFLNHFMSGGTSTKVYRMLSAIVAEKIKLDTYLEQWEIDSYIESDIFDRFDIRLIRYILDQLLAGVGEFERFMALVRNRRTKHWYPEYENEYNSLYWACSLLNDWKNNKDTIKDYTSAEFFKKYIEGYYRIDKDYRRFIYYFDLAANKEWLLTLKELVENTYINGYLNTLAVKWSNGITDLKDYWGIPTLDYQWQFFERQIKPHLVKGERVFVIISDALRFEAGKAFADILNTERKGSTEIMAMQGVLPSYTKLGMAVLLPHQKIEIKEDYSILVDGILSESTENRNKILNTYVPNSITTQYRDVIDLKRDDLRKLFNGKDVAYIYHNGIDAKGDHYPTEREVFKAVEDTFDQLKNLINTLINHLTATYIYIVADHGFIYKRGMITESEKTIKDKLQDSYENRRFILTDKDESIEGTLTFKMNYLLGPETELKCITPKGVNRFEIKGPGANYVHGGASLQEMVIPVIRFKNERGKTAKDIQKVKVTLTSLTRKITNTITYLEFFQTEKIADKRVPCRLKIYFEDEDGNRISNESIIIADIKSDDPNQRKFKEKFVLKNLKYDKTKKYYLIFEDEEEPIENIYEKVPFIIDLAFGNHEFGL